MPFATKYVLIANMDIDPDKEDLFNEIYDTEHVPYFLTVPGVNSAARLKSIPLTMNRPSGPQTYEAAGVLAYSAVYEIDGPDVLLTAAWSDMVDKGRWATEVRPFTKNRHYELRKVIWPGG